MRKGLLILAAALLVLAPVSAYADRGGGDFEDHDGGHVFIGGGDWGGGWGGGWGWDDGWGPWGGGWWAPTYTTRYINTGTVKIDTGVKDAQIYVNGSYLGIAKDNKTIRLKPGAYKIEIREPGRAPYLANIYVTVGKTIKLHPDE